jgi:hypothetical protein
MERVMRSSFWKLFSLVQIFNAISSMFLSAPAELRIFIPRPAMIPNVQKETHTLLGSFAQYILGVRHGRIPSKNISERLNLQWRFHNSQKLDF